MDEVLRQLFQPAPEDPVEQERLDRLRRGEVDALMQLFDELAPLAYGWALLLTKSRRQSLRSVRGAFLAAARNPEVFCNNRVSSRGWILLEIHHQAWTLRNGRTLPAGAAGRNDRFGGDRPLLLDSAYGGIP